MDISWDHLPEVTLLIRQSQAGDRQAEDRLFGMMYPYLKHLASRMTRRLGLLDSSSAQDVVHDVYLGRLRGYQGAVSDRAHYIAFVTSAMKNHLIDRARQAKAQKRTPPLGAGFPDQAPSELSCELIVALEREIERIERMDWRAAQVVRLRYYAGCSWDETASALDATSKMVRNDWEFASDWLRKRLGRRR